MLKPCCRNLFKIADLFCHLASSFNRTACMHTRQMWLKNGWLPTAVNSLVKMNGLRTRLTSTLWTTMSGELCLNATSHFNPAGEHRWARESSAVDMGPAATEGLDQRSHSKLLACVKAGCGHFEHTLKWTTCQILVFVITVNVSWQWKLQVAVDYSGWASTSTISVLDVHVAPGGTAHLPPHVDPVLKSIACMPADITGNWADKRDFMLDALPVATVPINQRFVLAPKHTSYIPVQCCGLNMLHILILHLPLVTSCH